jgi:hypothetical protein
VVTVHLVTALLVARLLLALTFLARVALVVSTVVALPEVLAQPQFLLA